MKKLILAAALLFATSINAAEVSVLSLADARKYIVLSGEIERGDPANVEYLLDIFKGKILGVYLKAPGGDFSAATRLGEIIKQNNLATIVGPGRECAEACFAAFLQGKPRTASATATLRLMRSGDDMPELSRALTTDELKAMEVVIGK